jgi:O-antigen/teichoic acid export membrane protein
LGVEARAAYSVAFGLTMVPVPLLGRAGTSLLVPVFAELDGAPELRRTRFLLSIELTVVLTACYLATFIMLGGGVVELVFGSNYAGLGHLTAVLATMWALRMLQMPFTSLLLAAGEPRTLTIGGAIRASALLLGGGVVMLGGGVVLLAATGIAGEALALWFHTHRVRRIEPVVYHAMMVRLACAPLVAVLCWPLIDSGAWIGSSLGMVVATLIVLAALGAGLLVIFAELRGRIRNLIRNSRGLRDAEIWSAAQVVEADPS